MTTPTSTPSPRAPESARPSSAGLIIVGIIAVGAFALGAYAALARRPAPASANTSHVTVSSVEADKRLASVEQRLGALEKEQSTYAARAKNTPVEAAAPASPPPPPVAAPVSSSTPPVIRDDTGAGYFEVVPNGELKGRLGRLVVEFPKANDLKARTEIFKAGGASGLRTEFGTFTAELTAGDYDLNIGGAIVANVTIRSGHDTRVHVGAVRLNATANTRFELFPPGESRSLGTYFGQTDVGLPVGTFEIDVNGVREGITILRGSIAEF